MATTEERREEAGQEARENRDCIGCALGLTHDHDEDQR